MYPCANSGQCVAEGNSRRCICTPPYYGDDCRERKKKKLIREKLIDDFI
jgi:hypothetical protein